MIKSKWEKSIAKVLCTTLLVTTMILQPLTNVVLAKKDNDEEKEYVRKPTKVRIYGNDRYETSSKIAKEGWSSSYYAIIASGEDFPDSLSAVTLSKKHDAPILLSNKNLLNKNTKEELTRMRVKKVFIIGGQASISSKVEQDIKSMGITTERLGGRDRYETSIKIAERLGNPGTLFVVTSNHFGDALSVGPIAAKKGAPIILTSKDNLSDYTKKYLYKKVFNKIYIVGDRAQISDKVASEFEKYVKNSQTNENAVERIDTKSNSSSIYERNINVIDKFPEQLNKYREIFVASGVAFADALSVNALAAKKEAPIVIGNTSDGNLLKSFISKNSSDIAIINIVGGQGVISESYVNNILNYIEDEEIEFTDENLAKAVREKLGITNENQRIYKSTVKDVQTLDLSGFSIENIDGIELFDGLKELNLSNNKIQDLEPLEDMFYLESINLSGNKRIEDLEPLEELHSLKYLNLSDNDIRYVDSLKELEYLKYLNLSKNDISYIEDFDDLTYLYYLDLSDNYNIGGLDELSDLKNLTTLKLNHTGISSLSFLEDLKELTELDLSENSISDLDDLKKLDNLKTLYLNDNSITYIEDLKDLKSLEELNVWGNDINDVEEFKKFKKLRKLTIDRSLLDDDDRRQLDLISNVSHIFDKENTYNKDNNDGIDFNPGNPPKDEYEEKELEDILKEAEEFKKDNENYKHDYNPYEIIYKSNSTYGGGFTAKELLNREKDLQSMIENSTSSMETRKMIQEDLEKVINRYGIINKTNRMNDKVMELEAKLNMSFDEKEKRKARNEINYVYSDYKYDFYKNAAAECEEAMSRLKAQIGELEYSKSYSDNEKARILRGELTNKQIEYYVINDNLNKYDNDRKFFAAMNSLLNK